MNRASSEEARSNRRLDFIKRVCQERAELCFNAPEERQTLLVSYDLRITRKPHLAEDDGPQIALQEWLELIASDEELTLDSDNNNGSGFAVWTHEGDPTDWFDFDEETGCLFSSSPTDAGVDKMVELALRLNARVQGQDGEIYDARRG
jgi:hypothetical protein